MKKVLIHFVVMLIFASQLFAGTVKKTKSEVYFKGFGTYTTVQTEKIAGEKKRSDSQNKFKGKGLVGRIAAKFFPKLGGVGEIIDLPAMTIYELDHKKKKYQVIPIEKILEGEEAWEEYEEKDAGESEIKIVRSEFKVDDTGETKNINQFPCKKYTITSVTEWENLRTGGKGTYRLFTIVWTTPITDAIKIAQIEEMNFTKEYMKRIGLDMDMIQKDILGTNWFSLFGKMSKTDDETWRSGLRFKKEMDKIKGYPVLIDGKYYSTSQETEEAEEKEETDIRDAKKILGRFAKKVLKKKPKTGEEQEPILTYYTELIEFSPASVGENEFQVPTNYKKKK